VGDHTKI